MTPDMWFTLAILLVAIVLFVTEWIRLDVVALGVVVALMLTGILTVDEAISGFSSKVVLSFAALFIVGGAVFNTGLAAYIGDRILRLANGSETRLLLVLAVSIGVMSAFISSTGVVALMLPAVVSLANSMKTSTSKLLIPLAFSALLGGSTTLIGTPPNLVVSETLQSAGYPAFDFFSFTPIGGLLLAVGVIYVMTIGRRLLPDRQPSQAVQQASTPGELFELYRLPDNLFRLRVQSRSPLVGRSLGEANLRRDYDLTVVAFSRQPKNQRTLLGRRHNGETHRPSPETTLAADDVLV
ncbi:MAG: SLC13 family permease, partial [Anaerolineae bacterium]|nr:SLC13 family permease [Anaerolineae bacterium]